MSLIIKYLWNKSFYTDMRLITTMKLVNNVMLILSQWYPPLLEGPCNTSSGRKDGVRDLANRLRNKIRDETVGLCSEYPCDRDKRKFGPFFFEFVGPLYKKILK